MGLLEILCVFVMLIVFLCSWALWTAFCRHHHNNAPHRPAHLCVLVVRLAVAWYLEIKLRIVLKIL